uniref:Uncharacterized protein n=1 Tax=Fagus sylvatica TaxID=28930 RepID=A0A2N9HDV2_FAGSY
MEPSNNLKIPPKVPPPPPPPIHQHHQSLSPLPTSTTATASLSRNSIFALSANSSPLSLPPTLSSPPPTPTTNPPIPYTLESSTSSINPATPSRRSSTTRSKQASPSRFSGSRSVRYCPRPTTRFAPASSLGLRLRSPTFPPLMPVAKPRLSVPEAVRRRLVA